MEMLLHLEGLTGSVSEGSKVPPGWVQSHRHAVMLMGTAAPQVPLSWQCCASRPHHPSRHTGGLSHLWEKHEDTGTALPAQHCLLGDTPAALRVPAAFIMALPHLPLRASLKGFGGGWERGGGRKGFNFAISMEKRPREGR